MNSTERKMVDLLKRLSDYGAISTKAEFEAEGTRPDELLRLVDITRTSHLKLTLKIGGCEAMKDLMDAKQIGANYIVAPMVESTYALEKFAASRDKVFDDVEKQDTDFLINMETAAAYEIRDKIVVRAAELSLDGIVFGRVDFSGSLGLDRSTIESQEITSSIVNVSKLVNKAQLDLVVGGAISVDSIGNLKKICTTYLTRFETRKIVFDSKCLELSNNELSEMLKMAVHFELLWLINKRDYYGSIHLEDTKRIEMLEKRWSVL